MLGLNIKILGSANLRPFPPISGDDVTILKPCVRNLFVPSSSTSEHGKGLRWTGCLLNWSLFGVHSAERKSSLIVCNHLPPAPDWEVAEWSVQLECLSREPATLGVWVFLAHSRLPSLLNCLQEWIPLVYKMYLLGNYATVCVYESDTMQTMKCLTKRNYEFIENWIQLQNSALCCRSIRLPSHRGPEKILPLPPLSLVPSPWLIALLDSNWCRVKGAERKHVHKDMRGK